MERHLSFHEPHRVRYTNNEGVCTHDCVITAKYEFVSVALSVQFQGALRRKQLVNFYDVDVVWTDKQSRTDAFGNVRGIGAIQRLKLWRDNYTASHSLTVLANKTDKQARPDVGGPSAQVAPVDIRHLDFQFTSREGYHQFLADWGRVQNADRSFNSSPNPRGIAGSVSSGFSLGAGSEGDPTSSAGERAESRAAEAPPS
ncbi:hypothetical protein ESCO_004254 [Escovopsis weberi]|uniref:Uncharacterized protein n=1 Tax=Escovopsis weberi TaxID=150374 RepID=A0A0N0RTS6_ESCWE|nr:hypothetical protein ESCO_004254 [Escovopsis weberi]